MNMIDGQTPGIDIDPDPPELDVCLRCKQFKPHESNEREPNNCEAYFSLDDRCRVVRNELDEANLAVAPD